MCIRDRSRGADIEQARLESHRHGESCQDQRRRPEKHVPDVSGVKSKGQGSRCIPACAEQAAKNQPDSIPRTGGREGIACLLYTSSAPAAVVQGLQWEIATISCLDPSPSHQGRISTVFSTVPRREEQSKTTVTQTATSVLPLGAIERRSAASACSFRRCV